MLRQFIDIFIGAFHRGQAARVFAREGFGTRPKERDEKVFADGGLTGGSDSGRRKYFCHHVDGESKQSIKNHKKS
jgi:hypothetical protein